jgi:hypothetical protein
MAHHRLFAALCLFAGGLGCDDSGEQKTTVNDDMTVRCGTPEKTSVAADQTTDVGTPQALADWINGEQKVPLKWWAYETGEDYPTVISTILSSSITVDPNSAEFITYGSNKTGCSDRLTLLGQMSFYSADHVFREDFTVSVSKTVASPEAAEIAGALALDQFNGMYNFEPMTAEYTKPTIYLDATATPRLKNGKMVVSGKKRSNESTLVAEFSGN